MNIMKKFLITLLTVGIVTHLTYAVSNTMQEKKKIAERKAKRAKEKTKGKAVAKPKSIKKSSSMRKQTVANSPVVKSSPKVRVTGSKKSSTPVAVNKKTVTPVATSRNKMQPVVTQLPPVMPVVMEEVIEDVPMPTNMPSRLSDELLAMVPSNLKNRIETIIMMQGNDAAMMIRSIYLLCWIDDQLMKMFDSSTFNTLLLEVISQESNVSYTVVEKMATDIKNQIDTVLVRFENAIIAGDMNNFEIQQVIDVFKQEEVYREYLDRCLRLATEYNQSRMVTVLRLALANAANAFTGNQQSDFDY